MDTDLERNSIFIYLFRFQVPPESVSVLYLVHLCGWFMQLQVGLLK